MGKGRPKSEDRSPKSEVGRISEECVTESVETVVVASERVVKFAQPSLACATEGKACTTILRYLLSFISEANSNYYRVHKRMIMIICQLQTSNFVYLQKQYS